jgi:hypothetical protein
MKKSVFAIGVALLAAGCGDSDESIGSGAVASPFQEMIDLGITRYFGTAQPVASEESQPGVITYTFDAASGPVCLQGDPYRMSVRDQYSEDLFIFLQGGGACWSDFCLAVTKAPPGIPDLDILDPQKPTNPLRSMSTVYLPYCDGSLFAGTSEYDDTGDGVPDRIQHGLQNLSAALDIAKQTFPHPKRVIRSGRASICWSSRTAAPAWRRRATPPSFKSSPANSVSLSGSPTRVWTAWETAT